MSVSVGRPSAAREEAVILQIDGTGSMALDERSTDVVIEMLDKARVNLGQRRRSGERRAQAQRRRRAR